MAPPQQDEDEETPSPLPATVHSRAFSVLHEKSVAVTKVALCPKMDLIALLAGDGSLVVLRTISWQKLHALPAAELRDENRVTALAWSPDGNVLALGHERGAISLFDVEKGEPSPLPLGARPPEALDLSEVLVLAWFTQHCDAPSLSALDWEKDQSRIAASYYLERDGVFLEDLPALGPQSGSFAAPKDRKEEPVGAKLTAGPASLDILVACFKSGGVLVLSSGLFPLLSLRVQDLVPSPLASSTNGGDSNCGDKPLFVFGTPSAPSLNPSSLQPTQPRATTPMASSPSPASSPHSMPWSSPPDKRPLQPHILRVQSITATPDLRTLLFAVGHGENAQDGTSLLALPTTSLWENRHQLKPLTSAFAALSSLVTHLQDALDLAERHWSESVRTLDIKLELLNNLLRDYACEASAREVFLSLVLSGVACPALNQYLSQNGSEPQQHNLFRLSKTIDEKVASVESLLREQVGRVAEMVVFHASKLRGLARMGDDYRAVGLSARALSSLVDAAVNLSLKAEETLKQVQEARQNLKVFLLWLLDTMKHLPAGTGEEAPAATTAGRLTFRHSTTHVRMLLAFLRRPYLPPPAAAAAAGDGKVEGGAKKPMVPGGNGNTEAVIAVQISAYFKDEPLLSAVEAAGAGATPSATAESGGGGGLASASLRMQVNEVRAQFEAVFKRPLEALKTRLAPSRSLRLSTRSLAAAPDLFVSPTADPSQILVATVEGQGTQATLLSIQVNSRAWKKSKSKLISTYSDLFFPLKTLSLSAPPDRIFQQASFYGGLPLLPSSNPESLVLLARGPPQFLNGRSSAEIWKLPLSSLLPSLTSTHNIDEEEEGLPLPSAGQGPSSGSGFEEPREKNVWSLGALEGVKARQVATAAPKQLVLSVTGCRGVGTLTSRSNHLVLVDLEEDDEEEEGEEEKSEEGDDMEVVERDDYYDDEEEEDEDAKSAS